MAKYYTQLTNDRPDLIEVKVELTAVQLAKIRKLTDAKASDSINEIVRKLIHMKTNNSISKVFKNERI